MCAYLHTYIHIYILLYIYIFICVVSTKVHVCPYWICKTMYMHVHVCVGVEGIVSTIPIFGWKSDAWNHQLSSRASAKVEDNSSTSNLGKSPKWSTWIYSAEKMRQTYRVLVGPKDFPWPWLKIHRNLGYSWPCVPTLWSFAWELIGMN